MKKRESVILVPILSAPPLLKDLRDRYDSNSLHGIPPHITILFPFKNPDEINEKDIDKLKKIFLRVKGFSFVLKRINTFPEVVYLEPSEKEKFINLTKEVMKDFPNYQPYEGKFTKINPHLTIGHELGERFNEALKNIRKEIEGKLPIKVKAQEVWLMKSENGRWRLREKFPLLI